MRLETYEAIRREIAATPCDAYPNVDALRAAHPELTLDALVSICVAGVVAKDPRRARTARARDRGARAAVPAGGGCVQRGAEFRLSGVSVDAVAARTPARGRAQGGGRRCCRDPHGKIPATPAPGTPAAAHGARLCRRLRLDVERVTAWDHHASPAVDALRHDAGKEYEELLEEMLAAEGIPFVTERDLRADGHARTPDVKLEVPIAVRGRIVNWIDSKASFSDPLVHVEKGVEQFQGYVNRFGPGMVIYWHGIVDELNDDPNVLLVDAFPPSSDIVKLRMI